MNTSEIIERLGGTTKVADMFGITPGAVSQWVHSGIPPSRLMYLRLARPDVFEEVEAGRKFGRRAGDMKN